MLNWFLFYPFWFSHLCSFFDFRCFIFHFPSLCVVPAVCFFWRSIPMTTTTPIRIPSFLPLNSNPVLCWLWFIGYFDFGRAFVPTKPPPFPHPAPPTRDQLLTMPNQPRDAPTSSCGSNSFWPMECHRAWPRSSHACPRHRTDRRLRCRHRAQLWR